MVGGDGGGSVMCDVLQGCKAAVCYCNDQEHVLQYIHTVQLCISDLIQISSYLKWLPNHLRLTNTDQSLHDRPTHSRPLPLLLLCHWCSVLTQYRLLTA